MRGHLNIETAVISVPNVEIDSALAADVKRIWRASAIGA